MEITGKVFVVTGGGNGIGREVVLGLLRKGARVAAVDLSEAGLVETLRLARAGSRLTTHTVDIADRGRLAALADEVVAAHGRVDGLVNVAGIIQPFVRVADLSFEAIERVMNVNFWGTVNTTKTFLPLLAARPAAALVNVSSMGALAPVPGQAAYGASKAAVKLLTEALWAELKDTRISVTVVFPGAVATGITQNSGVAIPGQQANEGGKTPKMTLPADAAAQIIRGIEKGSYRVVIGNDARMLDRISRLAPKRATALIADKMKDLLKPTSN